MPTIAQILTQSSNDKVEIKSQVNLNGEAFKVFKQFIESMNVYEQATKIESKNLSSAVTGFILGHPFLGVLGTDKLGDTGKEFEVVRVIPPNRTFTERFIGTEFINQSSTAVVSGESANFSSGHYLESELIYKDEETISNATLSLTYDSGSGNLSSYVSSDSGVTFTEVTPGISSSITPGEDIIYKIVATGNAQINKLEVIV